MKQRFLFGLITVVILLIYGVLRFPAALSGFSGLIGVFVILIIYGLIFWFWIPSIERHDPQIVQIGARSGLLIGIIFTGEMILEYILLLKDNTKMGLIEYGSVFVIFIIASMWVAYQTNHFRDGVFTAIVRALIGSVIWLIAALSVFYLFHGTPQQTQVFQAEGNFEDFARSGMTDFDAFILQDFWGAGFFHSILLPLFAGVLGCIGSLAGVLSAQFIRRNKQ